MSPSRIQDEIVDMSAQPSNESELQLYRVLQRANLLSYYDTFICQGGDDVQQLCEAGEEEFLEIMALVGMASKPLHVRRLQKALQEWVNNPGIFQAPLGTLQNTSSSSSCCGGSLQRTRPSPVLRRSSPIPLLSNSNSQSSPSPGCKDTYSPQHNSSITFHQALGEYVQPLGSPSSVTPVLVESQIQRLADAADVLVKTLPSFDPKPQNNKKKICRDLENVIRMTYDDPKRMEEIRKYAAIYGRFDCKRKPEKPLTLHEVSVNEAAAQICKHIPALLTRRDELFPLARQVVRDSGYQYSKGHSRSQCYSKSYDDEACSKRLRFEESPNCVSDQSQMEEERKRRQDRLDVVTEQINVLTGQQHDLKAGLQVHDKQNAGQIQLQLENLASQHYQLVTEQSELSGQIQRLDRYFSEYRYGLRSSCSETEKGDTDDTDSQFSVYSYESSTSPNQETSDSCLQETNQHTQGSDCYTSKNLNAKKTNVQITKQLVQEALFDEGLRVVKELASQIKDFNSESLPDISSEESGPQKNPVRMDKGYILNTRVSVISKDLEKSTTIPQNGHVVYSSTECIDCDQVEDEHSIIYSLRSGRRAHTNGVKSIVKDNMVQDDDSERSLKALLELSQTNIKQEPSSPSNSTKTG